MISGARVAITGLGLITPLGNDPDTLWSRLLTGDSAARHWDDLAGEDFRHTVACRVTDLGGSSRGRSLAVSAARAAVANADVDLPAGAGVFVGSTMGESSAFEAAAHGDLTTETCVAFPRAIGDALQLTGPCRAYGTACAAGNYAIGAAAAMLGQRRLDVALAGGVEPFSRIAMTGFSRSRAMSSSGVCRPFDAHRDGMLLGEGAAMMVLERETDALARGARPLATVGALGLSCDAHHPTAPHPEGRGAAAAFLDALSTQRLAPSDIDWICAHGSGTLLSDAAESRAITTVFGTDGPAVTGLKGALGHAMGAATAIEAAICALAITRQTLPPTAGLVEPEFPLNHIREPRPARPRWVANAGFAFGGLNAVLLLGSP